MIISRVEVKDEAKSKPSLVPSFEELLANRDYTGALTLLEFNPKSNDNELWKACCHFRLAEYKKAIEIYEKLKQSGSSLLDLDLYIDCCKFYRGESIDATKLSNYSGPHRALAKRLQTYVGQRRDSKAESIDSLASKMATASVEDQLCLASLYFYKNQFQEAIDIYKRILLEMKTYLALNVYIALCYYKLDYYDVAQEVLSLYLQKHPKSIVAANLKACNNYRLYNGATAENEIRNLIESFPANFSYAKDLIRHNLVVFLNGEGAFQVLPLLINSIPEAKLNLIIYYLKNEKNEEAYSLIKDVEPKLPNEFILKAIVNANIGQEQKSHEHLKMAQHYFQLIGSSPTECDTIQGRQCMASYFFLIRQLEEVSLYLSSIKSYFYNDDTFNFNYGQVKMFTHSFKEAEEAFLLIESKKIQSELVYICCITRCYIMNQKPAKAWEMFLKYQNSKESTVLLHLIANDCYKMGQFLTALRAFDILEKIDKSPEYWEGKRGAAAGVLQLVIAKVDPIEHLYEAIKLMRSSANPQANQILNIMKNYPK